MGDAVEAFESLPRLQKSAKGPGLQRFAELNGLPRRLIASQIRNPSANKLSGSACVSSALPEAFARLGSSGTETRLYLQEHAAGILQRINILFYIIYA